MVPPSLHVPRRQVHPWEEELRQLLGDKAVPALRRLRGHPRQEGLQAEAVGGGEAVGAEERVAEVVAAAADVAAVAERVAQDTLDLNHSSNSIVATFSDKINLLKCAK